MGRVRRVAVMGDGSCAFRALAVSFLHTFFGLCALPEPLETLAAAWLRCVAVQMIWGGARAVRETERKLRSSLPHALFDIARAASAEHPATMPLPRDPPALLYGAPTPRAAMVEGGVPVSDAIRPAAHRAYCTSMLKRTSWGGDLEIAALHAVLRLRVETYDARGALLNRHGGADAAPLRVLWTGHHYDALVGDEPPLLAL